MYWVFEMLVFDGLLVLVVNFCLGIYYKWLDMWIFCKGWSGVLEDSI